MTHSIRLAVFEGPLHLLLHLIRAQKLEIYDIPIASVTEQYLEYLALMEELNLDVAGEFLVMAATLMEIKSRLLLPRPPREPSGEEEGPDPREELVRRLLEYERYQRVVEDLRALEQQARASFPRAPAEAPPLPGLQEVSADALLGAMRRMLTEHADGNGREGPVVRVRREPLNLKARVIEVWQRVRGARDPVPFDELLPPERRSRRQIIVTFLAILELLRDRRIMAWQEGPRGRILLSPGAGEGSEGAAPGNGEEARE
jgi:segregation and condensation protein A